MNWGRAGSRESSFLFCRPELVVNQSDSVKVQTVSKAAVHVTATASNINQKIETVLSSKPSGSTGDEGGV